MPKVFFLKRRNWRDERGATAIEYALIAALISIVAITALSTVGDKVKAIFETVGTQLTTVDDGG